MKKMLILAFAALALVGCATSDYSTYAKAQTDAARHESEAETARIIALAKIAESGDAATKAGAVMALALSGNKTKTTVQAPQNEALAWAQVLSPLAGQGLQGLFSYAQGVRQSDNAVKTEGIRYGTMSNIAGAGIAAAAKDPLVVRPEIVTPTVVEVPSTQ